MKTRLLYPCPNLFARTARYCLQPLLAATLLLLPQAALSQALSTAASSSQLPLAVRNGSATLTQHYDANKLLRVTISLRPPHMVQERQLIDQLHDKTSPMFHKWLSPEEWDARFAPSAEDEQAVVDWANGQGLTVSHRYPDRLLVDVVASAGALENAFHVTINNYSLGGDTYYSNDREPQLPSSIAGAVQAVLGLDNFLRLRPALSSSHSLPPRPDFVPGPPAANEPEKRANGSAEKLAEALKQSSAHASVQPLDAPYSYAPTDLYSSQAYNYNALQGLGHCCNPVSNPNVSPAEATIAIGAFADLDYNDVASFHAQYPYLAYNLQKRYIDGTYTCNNQPGNPDDGCIEVTLDTEWSLSTSNSFGAASDTAKIWIYEAPNYGDIFDMYNTMVSDGFAKVTTTSWYCPGEIGCYVSGGMDTLDGIFNKMVGQGWTLVAASGDNGASGGCGDGDAVMFPASDPNVIAAGGTLLTLGSGPIYESEVAWQGGTYTGACGHNNGGSTGGFSAYWGAPSYQTFQGFAQRGIPDISLNAAHGQNVYDAAAGGLVSYGGTSIVSPELAGFFAQENAYGLSIGSVCGSSGAAACAPIGNANYYIYEEAHYATAPHYPFYDITSGCNSNDITAEFDLGYYCAGSGWDAVTGWGTANLLQLAWAINWYDAKANGRPSISFGGPTTNTWYNSDQIVDWDVIDNIGTDGGSGTGIAGYTQGWDFIQSDSYSLSTPGAGDSFYSGPQHVNSDFGCTDLNGSLCSGGPVSQGCHTVYVDGWNNMGVPSFIQSYGPICYDTIAPTATISLSGTVSGGVYLSSVAVTLKAVDPGAGSTGSGVKAIYYTLDGGALTLYGGGFTVSATGGHTITYHAVDIAGNQQATQSDTFDIESPTATTLSVSTTSTKYGDTITLTAKVSATFGGVPAGTVKFYLNSTTSVSAPVSGAGTATYALPASLLKIGANSIYALFVATSKDASSKSTTTTVTVAQAGTTTKLTSSANPDAYGNSVTLTATVTPSTSGTPSGTVVFKTGTTSYSVALVSSVAKLVLGSEAVGSYPFTATYGGSTGYLTSTSATLTQVVKAAATKTLLSSSANPETYGAKFTLTAIVKPTTSGTPTGTVVFKTGTTTYTVALSSGVAKLFTSEPVGSYPFTASYGGSTDYLASTSATLTQVVEAAVTKTALTSSLNPATKGQAVTFTATVSATNGFVPTGTVQFFSNGTLIGSGTLSRKTSESSVASFKTTTLATGTDSIQAIYEASTDFSTSKSPDLSEVIKP